MSPDSKLPNRVRTLAVVLGDQLNFDSALFDRFDAERDCLWMAEVTEESTHVWTHKARIALFLAAMRHFRDEALRRNYPLRYVTLGGKKTHRTSLASELKNAISVLQPDCVALVEPGEWRLRDCLSQVVREAGIELKLLPDRHFLCSHDEFAEHCHGRKQLRMEYFYREMRRRYGILMDGDDPEGGKWNFDSDNRKSFSKSGPPERRIPCRFRPDEVTQGVLRLVEDRFAEHPGSLEAFAWPVTRRQARAALRDFVDHRLAEFGDYQDAMWQDEPFLFHSRLSAALNLKLLSPREVIDEAVAAYKAGNVSLNSVEGFVRQILGWREYVRGVYWRFMPEYLERNSMRAEEDLPEFYWTGETEMQCLRQAVGQTLQYGYAHHIQRLMITGLFSLLLGVHPRQVHEWYLAVYVDAVEWVELPNSLGMSQFGDGGIMASKPYVASGKYIDRMSNYCQHCRFDPGAATGDDACPFTTLYWDFLMRHEKSLHGNNRMTLQLKNMNRKSSDEKRAIKRAAKQLREHIPRRRSNDE